MRTSASTNESLEDVSPVHGSVQPNRQKKNILHSMHSRTTTTTKTAEKEKRRSAKEKKNEKLSSIREQEMKKNVRPNGATESDDNAGQFKDRWRLSFCPVFARLFPLHIR